MARPLILAAIVLSLAQAAVAEDLKVLNSPELRGTALSEHFKQRAHAAIQERLARLAGVSTPADQAAWQKRLREKFVARLGGFPERTPLNAKTIGRLPGEGYRIEKVIYESQPRHYVTANLYLPDAQPPYPAVLVPSGHSKEGKAAGYNQLTAILLARHGIAALCYDPIGQGERSQLLDAEGKPRFNSTTEHTLVGAGSIPLGRGTATFRIWDGIRSLDYLAERGDVDMTKIGVTGCSGGGTLSSYLMALDERIACAAPSCYLTSFARLIDTIGPQDAEQNIQGQLAWGMDHADYILMRAPKPTLILAATGDFFDINGTWDTFRQAKQFYTRLGFAERVDLVETPTKHGYPQSQREPMVRWMRRWLQGIDEPATEAPAQPLPESELLCTPQGQVMLLEGARSVADLNVELNETLAAGRKALWSGDRKKALDEVRRITGIRTPPELEPRGPERVGTLERNGYQVEKLAWSMNRRGPLAVPALLFKPPQATAAPVLYLHGEGKHVDAEPGGAIERLVLAGHTVLAVDLSGVGETAAGAPGLWGSDWRPIFLAYLLDDSLLALRAEQTLELGRQLALLTGNEQAKVRLVATGVAGPPALHAAALQIDRFERLTLRDTLDAWSSVVRDPDMPGQLAGAVHRALVSYDLPDLAASLPAGMLSE